MLGELPGQKKTHGSLDFPTGDRVLLVIVGQARGFGCHALEDVVDEGVHDAHGFAGNSRLGVNLLQDFVYVDGVALLSGLSLLLALPSRRLGFRDGFLLALFGCNFSRHCFLSLSFEKTGATSTRIGFISDQADHLRRIASRTANQITVLHQRARNCVVAFDWSEQT